MENNRRDPITGEWDDPLGDWANEAPADHSDSANFAREAAADTPRDPGPDSEDERVGYGRPPRKHMFKKGQSSPHPAGRPKGVKNEATIVKELLEEKIQIRVGGRVRTVTKRKAILMRFRDEALKGDIKSAIFILNRKNQHASNDLEQTEIGQDDRAILDAFMKRTKHSEKGPK